MMPIMRELMPVLQQSGVDSPVHELGRGEACTLTPTAHTRCLLITQGGAWITGIPSEHPSGDVWVHAGEVAWIPAGCAPVLEGHPQVRFVLLEQRCPTSEPSHRERGRWPWRAWLTRRVWGPATLAGPA